MNATVNTSRDGVVIDGVAKHFDDVAVLSDFHLSVSRGEFVSIIGPSGCGKSTLLRIVAGLIAADVGNVSIFGESTSRASERKHIGFVPQRPALLPWRTVLENVALLRNVNRSANARAATQDPRALLEAFGLGAVLDYLPHQLSGGMAQRVAIARAFAIDPPLLLMDEPFSALDELTRETLRYDLLQRWQENQKTVIFITHSVTEAVLLSDRTVVMSAVAGKAAQVIDIALDRPRHLGVELSDAFREREATVRAALRSGSAV